MSPINNWTPNCMPAAPVILCEGWLKTADNTINVLASIPVDLWLTLKNKQMALWDRDSKAYACLYTPLLIAEGLGAVFCGSVALAVKIAILSPLYLLQGLCTDPAILVLDFFLRNTIILFGAMPIVIIAGLGHSLPQVSLD